MIYIINYDIKSSELNNIVKDNLEKIIINCLDYNNKNMKGMINGIIGSNNLLDEKSLIYIIKNSYLLKDNIFEYIFNYTYKKIYLINISHKQEKFLYNNFRNKYKYINCEYDRSKDNIILPLKMLMFLSEDRESLFNVKQMFNIKYIIKFISYNLPLTDLNQKDLILNYNFLMDLEKYCFVIKDKNILANLLTNFIVPNTSYSLRFPPKPETKKKVNKKKLRNMSTKDLEKLARKTMTIYMKNRNKQLFDKNIKIEEENIGGLL